MSDLAESLEALVPELVAFAGGPMAALGDVDALWASCNGALQDDANRQAPSKAQPPTSPPPSHMLCRPRSPSEEPEPSAKKNKCNDKSKAKAKDGTEKQSQGGPTNIGARVDRP